MKVRDPRAMLARLGVIAVLFLTAPVFAAGTIVPYTKHSSSITIRFSRWRIPSINISWNWEESFRKVLLSPGQTNFMPGLAGDDALGATTTFIYAPDMMNMNMLILDDGMGGTATYQITSGTVDYTTGPNIGGSIQIGVTGLDIHASLIGPDTLGTGSSARLMFDSQLGTGTMFVGHPNDPPVVHSTPSGLLTRVNAVFPNSSFPEDQLCEVGDGDWGAEFTTIPAGASLLPLLAYFISPRRRR